MMNNPDWKDIWCPDLNNGDLTLREVYESMPGDQPAAIPLVIRLFENPKYFTCLPGSIDLFGHDCLHIILGRGVYAQDEAFVIGYSMGTDLDTKPRHVKFFKFLGKYVYQGTKKFTEEDYKAFDLGFDFARQSLFRNMHKLNFNVLLDENIGYIREMLCINHYLLNQYRNYEKIMLPNTKASNRL